MKVTILNTSILTAHGSFSYKSCSLEQAKELVADGYQSAIGHESTAEIISTLLGVEVKMNRIQYQQQQGDKALVFKLKARAPEGKILTADEIEKVGYEWGILECHHEEETTQNDLDKFNTLAATCPQRKRNFCSISYVEGLGADKCCSKICAVWHFSK